MQARARDGGARGRGLLTLRGAVASDEPNKEVEIAAPFHHARAGTRGHAVWKGGSRRFMRVANEWDRSVQIKARLHEMDKQHRKHTNKRGTEVCLGGGGAWEEGRGTQRHQRDWAFPKPSQVPREKPEMVVPSLQPTTTCVPTPHCDRAATGISATPARPSLLATAECVVVRLRDTRTA